MTGSESSSGGGPSGIYEAFEKSLLRDHTRQESEYIDSLQDADLVETFDKGRVEMYRMGYAMPYVIPTMVHKIHMDLTCRSSQLSA
jgi:hypothetical protein